MKDIDELRDKIQNAQIVRPIGVSRKKHKEKIAKLIQEYTKERSKEFIEKAMEKK